MKRFEAGSMIPGSTWSTQAETEGEVVRRVVEHFRNARGEREIGSDTIERIKQRIIDVADTTKH